MKFPLWIKLPAAVAIAALSFALGRATDSDRPRDDPTLAAPTPTKLRIADDERPAGTAANLGRGTTPTAAGAVTLELPKRPRALLMAIEDGFWGRGDRFAASAAWIELVDRMTPAELEATLEEYAVADIGVQRVLNDEINVLLAKWAELDPERALKAARSLDPQLSNRKQESIAAVLSSWASDNSTAAFAWINANIPNPGYRDRLLGDVIAGMLPEQIEEASRLVKSIDPARRDVQRGALAAIAANFEAGDPAARQWALSFTDEATRSQAVAAVASRLAFSDPAAAAEWLDDNGGSDPDGATLNSILNRWSAADPAAAEVFLSRVDDPVRRSRALDGMVDRLLVDDPQAAVTLVRTYSQDVPAERLEKLVNALGARRGALAVELAAAAPDPEAVAKLRRTAVTRWAYSDPDAASAWLDANNSSFDTATLEALRKVTDRWR